MTEQDPLASARAALEAGRWEEARAGFAAALVERETPEALKGMGVALWWLGETRASVAHTERAYAGFRRAGEAVSAAVAAISLCVTRKAWPCSTRRWRARSAASATASTPWRSPATC